MKKDGPLTFFENKPKLRKKDGVTPQIGSFFKKCKGICPFYLFFPHFSKNGKMLAHAFFHKFGTFFKKCKVHPILLILTHFSNCVKGLVHRIEWTDPSTFRKMNQKENLSQIEKKG